MASLSVSKASRLKPKLANISSPFSLRSTAFFCASPSSDSPSAAEPQVAGFQDAAGTSPVPARPLRGKHKTPEKLEDVISRMMANRAWTTRLQNSIRNLVPVFDHDLVYNVLHAAKNSEHALQFFRWVDRAGLFQHNRETHFKIIQILGRASKLNHARCILLDMPKKGVGWDEDLWIVMIESYGEAGIVQESVKLFQKMEELGVERTVKSYNALFKVISRRGRYMMAKRLSIPTEAGHYGVLIENFCKAGSYERAIQLLDKLVEKGIILRPENTFHMESSAYNVIIEYLCNNGLTGKAEALMRQLMKTGVQDPVALNNLIRGHASEGAPESASELLKIMIRRKVLTEDSAYKSLVDCYLKKGEPSDAKMVLDSMIESGHLPDSSLYRSVMESLFEDGRVQTASRVMKTMLDKGVKEHLDLLEKILEALLMRGHVEEALGRIDLMMQSGLAPDFDRLLSVLCEKEKTIAALKLLDFGLERDFNIDFSSYDKVLDALLAAGKTLNAYSVLCKITEKGGATNHSSCEELIKSLNKEGNTKQADILSRMIKGNGSKKGMKKVPIAS
nr:pentatricopeptide repeat-containing protein At2g37230 [Ipomoea trifida]